MASSYAVRVHLHRCQRQRCDNSDDASDTALIENNGH